MYYKIDIVTPNGYTDFVIVQAENYTQAIDKFSDITSNIKYKIIDVNEVKNGFDIR